MYILWGDINLVISFSATEELGYSKYNEIYPVIQILEKFSFLISSEYKGGFGEVTLPGGSCPPPVCQTTSLHRYRRRQWVSSRHLGQGLITLK